MADFEAAWTRIAEVCPFFEYKKTDWDYMYSAYRPRVEAADGNEFLSLLHELLAELKDGHVYYKKEPDNWVVPYRPARRVRAYYAFSLPLVRSYFDSELKVTKECGALYEKLPDNIGYIFLASMNKTDVADEFPGIMEYVKDTKGLIIDIRSRKGGTIQKVEAVVTRFTTSPIALPTLYFLGELYPMDPFQPQGPTYTNPVAVLINAQTFSAGESTTEILKQLPNVTVIGETTGGGGGTASAHSIATMGNFELPSGFMINIPTGYGLRYDGQHFEWLGVPPDILVERTEEDIKNGRDKQLEYAIELLK